MAKWRREAELERKRELADEGEVRRLRAENRILSCRIQSLEKENNTLAHNLIQRSVKQAIEAEEKILLGKELKLRLEINGHIFAIIFLRIFWCTFSARIAKHGQNGFLVSRRYF